MIGIVVLVLAVREMNEKEMGLWGPGDRKGCLIVHEIKLRDYKRINRDPEITVHDLWNMRRGIYDLIIMGQLP